MYCENKLKWVFLTKTSSVNVILLNESAIISYLQMRKFNFLSFDCFGSSKLSPPNFRVLDLIPLKLTFSLKLKGANIR